ncbi:hypothetical protein Rhe02_09440 [Rhizocola hellebori]|uniref:Uncharacterized protein n=1 Tax=Rhizocola hellebori TaxID=1392758 RepID=A0A8J3VE06_9ACTN|nr:hypothetical protein [Rhizocola hellebori]GIH02877.1 hypothetical protein Rhe02_09440 [Rhizocola hellebori]
MLDNQLEMVPRRKLSAFEHVADGGVADGTPQAQGDHAGTGLALMHVDLVNSPPQPIECYFACHGAILDHAGDSAPYGFCQVM